MTTRFNDELLYPLEADPPLGETLLVGAQHVGAMFAGIVAPIYIVAGSLGFGDAERGVLIAMALFASGLATLVQVAGIGPVGSGLLSVQGTSFTFVRLAQQLGAAPAVAAAGPEAAFALIVGMTIVAAPAEVLVSQLIGRARRLFPPVVTGTTVLLIGLTLVQVSVAHVVGFDRGAADFAAPARLGLAAITFLVILAANRSGRPALRVASVLLGMLAGTAAAAALGRVDLGGLGGAAWISLPSPLRYGVRVDLRYLAPWVLAYLVTSIETVGDLTATSVVSNEPISGPEYRRRIAGGTLGDAVGSVIAGVFTSMPNTTFSQNNGVIQATGVASRKVGYAVAGFLMLLGLSPKVGALVGAIPDPVLGGATLFLFGSVAAGGVRILSLSPLGGREMTILAAGLGVGLAVDGEPALLSRLPEWVQVTFGTGLVTGTVVAMALNTALRDPSDEAGAKGG